MRFFLLHYLFEILSADYDQNSGRRGRAAIPNAQGVTEFRVLIDNDRNGGTIVDPSDDDSANWTAAGTDTHRFHQLLARDGSSVRFWVEARDLAGHFARDSFQFWSDSTPPVVYDIKMVIDLHGIRY